MSSLIIISDVLNLKLNDTILVVIGILGVMSFILGATVYIGYQ